MNSRMINVLLADDSTIMRRGLRTTLEAVGGIHIVAEAGTGVDAVESARRYLPDVALVDVQMPGGDGITATRRMLQLPRPPGVIVLTTFDYDEYISQALRAGAAGFLLKDSPPEEIVRAVRLVHGGHGAIDPQVTRRAVGLLSDPPPRLAPVEQDRLDTLSGREREVLRLLAGGLANAAIAAELHTSESTVKGHVSRIMTKLGADNRVQAARIAYRAGLDEPDGGS
ncbi:response regulator transcription factor [Streptomyces sp. NBC_01304]|uniref:response regulator transcription factor n=1 Tax=Streptomyces sp. NBC_01304 TaxID=2903818 RepID=UPI002E0F83C3|nr:response regulator transcription factor [Streptomyces sp. NBC_01304]